MIFRSDAAPKNRRTTSSKKRRSQNILDVNIRAHAAASQRNRKIMKWLCILILLGTVSAGVYLGAREGLRRFLFENPDYRVTSLEIVTDGALTRDQIIQASGIHEGANIFSINLPRAEQNLVRMPRVETAILTRTLPSRIAIAITERKPVAWVAAKNTEDPSSDPGSFLVDRRGTLISGRNYLPEYLHLPIIYGIPTDNLEAGETVDTYELRAALDLVRITGESAKVQVRSIDLSKRYCMVVTDRSRARITFGLEKIDEQLDRLAAVLEHVETTKQELQTVNLMVQRNIPVTFGAPRADESAAPEKIQGTERAERTEGTQKPQPEVKKGAAHPKARPSAPSSPPRPKESRAGAPKPVKKPSPAETQHFMENMPVRKALPVHSAPDSSRHHG